MKHSCYIQDRWSSSEEKKKEKEAIRWNTEQKCVYVCKGEETKKETTVSEDSHLVLVIRHVARARMGKDGGWMVGAKEEGGRDEQSVHPIKDGF